MKVEKFLDEVFKFKIGDIVKHKAQKEVKSTNDYVTWGETDICRFFIIERHLQQCPGGIQKNYHCRIVNAKVAFKDFQIHLEEELELSSR